MRDTGIFAWLGRASICGVPEVECAAKVLRDYYQGVGPEPEYEEARHSISDGEMPELPKSRHKAGDFESRAEVYADHEVRRIVRDAIATDRRARQGGNEKGKTE